MEAERFKAAKSQLQVKIIGETKSYNVSATVVDKESLTSQASFNEDCNFAALENRAVLKNAVQSILGQLGVALGSTAKKELKTTAADSNRSIEAQKLVAQAQKAEEQGSNVAALRLAMAASRRDASLERAAATKSRVSQTVQSGDFGAKARNAIQRRKEMKALIDETKAYYADNLPYMFVYAPEIKQGYIDYE